MKGIYMQVNNNYTSLLQYQRPSIPEQRESSPITIPEFNDQEIVDTIKDDLQETIEQYTQDKEAKKDELRAFLADYAGVQSKKNQWDIYMSVMTESDVDTSNDSSIDFLKNLRDVQEQNNRVAAYALYQEMGKQ